MTKIFIGFGTVVLMLILLFTSTPSDDTGLLRLHIRANSNAVVDQSVKYEIRDAVVEYLTPKVCTVQSFGEAKDIINANLNNIKLIADNVLSSKGFDYVSNPKINNEYFPTRSYEGYVVENGYYDALIIELGEAKGDNWWCVVYPPLCFVNTEYTNGKGVVYKSKILAIIEKFIKGE